MLNDVKWNFFFNPQDSSDNPRPTNFAGDNRVTIWWDIRGHNYDGNSTGILHAMLILFGPDYAVFCRNWIIFSKIKETMIIEAPNPCSIRPKLPCWILIPSMILQVITNFDFHIKVLIIASRLVLEISEWSIIHVAFHWYGVNSSWFCSFLECSHVMLHDIVIIMKLVIVVLSEISSTYHSMSLYFLNYHPYSASKSMLHLNIFNMKLRIML